MNVGKLIHCLIRRVQPLRSLKNKKFSQHGPFRMILRKVMLGLWFFLFETDSLFTEPKLTTLDIRYPLQNSLISSFIRLHHSLRKSYYLIMSLMVQIRQDITSSCNNSCFTIVRPQVYCDNCFLWTSLYCANTTPFSCYLQLKSKLQGNRNTYERIYCESFQFSFLIMFNLKKNLFLINTSIKVRFLLKKEVSYNSNFMNCMRVEIEHPKADRASWPTWETHCSLPSLPPSDLHVTLNVNLGWDLSHRGF